MVGPWFTTPWRLVSQSHGAVAWRFLSPIVSRSVLLASPRCPVPRCHIPSLAQSLRPIPHPVFIPHRAASNPVTRAHWILIHPGTVSRSLHGLLLSRPPSFRGFVSRSLGGCCEALATPLPCPLQLFPSRIPCLYPTGPPPTHWRGPTGSSSIRGPFRAPCTGRSYPACFSRAHFVFFFPAADDPVRAVSHTSHVKVLVGYLCYGTRTQRLLAAAAQQGRHHTYPCRGLEGVVCSVFVLRLRSCRPCCCRYEGRAAHLFYLC